MLTGLRAVTALILPGFLAGGLVVLASAEEASGEAPGLEGLGRQFVELLAEGNFEEAAVRFDETMTTAMPVASLSRTWETVTLQAGPYEKIVAVELVSAGGYDAAIVTTAFTNAAVDIRVVFDTQRRVAGLFFAPSARGTGPAASGDAGAAADVPPYADPDAFTEQDVTFGLPGWELPGTLAVPKGGGPFPAAVLVHGSGPNDRDEAVGKSRPFRDLAWGLASRGVVVLRYDKRTFVHKQKLIADSSGLTVQEETIDDALAGAAFLRARDDVREDGVFVIGHSLGGMLVPRMAAQDETLAGLAVLAGPARPLHVILPEQLEYLSLLDGSISSAEQARIDEAKAGRVAIDALDPDDDKAMRSIILGVPGRYWADLRGYSPPSEARSIDRPLLVLHGGRDYQVTDEEFAAWRKALADRPNVTLEAYPALNHLFIAGEGKSGPGEYAKGGHVAAEVVGDIARWVNENGGGSATSPRP